MEALQVASPAVEGGTYENLEVEVENPGVLLIGDLEAARDSPMGVAGHLDVFRKTRMDVRAAVGVGVGGMSCSLLERVWKSPSSLWVAAAAVVVLRSCSRMAMVGQVEILPALYFEVEEDAAEEVLGVLFQVQHEQTYAEMWRVPRPFSPFPPFADSLAESLQHSVGLVFSLQSARQWHFELPL